MELEGETRGFSDKEEEEEEEEEDISRNTPNSSNYTDFLPERHANQWQTACSTSKTTANHHNHLSDHDGATRSYNQIAPAEAINFIDLSLKIDTDHSLPDGNSGGGSSDQPVISTGSCFEREHMFDKVVTPSDVGKLNRLVIPKQHAERYFPLDSSTNEKGLILNFEDRNGKSWRFRYSYWNSSQSYVMTKGWSRFVKEKKLNAGDVVSFQRGAGELRKDRLFIDWRRRPDTPPVPPLNPLSLNHLQSVRYNWGGNYSIRQYMGSTNSPSSGQLAPLPFPRYGDIYPNYNHYHQNFDFSGRVSRDDYNVLNFGSRSIYGAAPMVIESVPVPFVGHAHGKSSSSSTSGHVNVAAKRLRLFGVNMECAHVNEEGSSASIGCHDDMLSSTTSIPDQFMTTLPLLSSPHDDLLPPADHNDLQSRLPVNQSEFPRTSGKAANAVSFDWMINPSP